MRNECERRRKVLGVGTDVALPLGGPFSYLAIQEKDIGF